MLARERVRYHGQPVAAVVAESRYDARDAVAAVEIDHEPLDAVVDPVEATDDGSPTIFQDAPDNVALTTELGDEGETDAAFESADDVVQSTWRTTA
jgi:carbon-monoxide dehydrogenase large subunit